MLPGITEPPWLFSPESFASAADDIPRTPSAAAADSAIRVLLPRMGRLLSCCYGASRTGPHSGRSKGRHFRDIRRLMRQTASLKGNIGHQPDQSISPHIHFGNWLPCGRTSAPIWRRCGAAACVLPFVTLRERSWEHDEGAVSIDTLVCGS